MNIDIDTSHLPALAIKDDKHLSDLVFDIASKHLVLNAAEAEQQAGENAGHEQCRHRHRAPCGHGINVRMMAGR